MLLYQNIFWQNVDFWNSVLIIFEKVWWKNCRSRWKISQESVKNHHLFGVVKVSGAYLRHPKSKVQKAENFDEKERWWCCLVTRQKFLCSVDNNLLFTKNLTITHEKFFQVIFKMLSLSKNNSKLWNYQELDLWKEWRNADKSVSWLLMIDFKKWAWI